MANREEVGDLVVKASLDSSGFRSEMKGLNQQMSLIKSSFKAANAELGPFATEMQKAEVRAQELNAEIEVQQQRVDALSKQYAASAESAGEDAAATQKLAVQLNNAKAALAGMRNDLELTNTAMEESGAAAEEAEIEQKSFSESMESTKSGIEGTHAALLGMVGLIGAGMLSDMTDGAEKTAISLQTLQDETGNSQSSLERLSLVASGAGVSMTDLTNMVGRMDRTIATANTPTSTMVKALNELGISSEAFAKANLSEQAQMVADAMHKSALPAKTLDSLLKSMGVNMALLPKGALPSLNQIRQGLELTQNSANTLARQFTAAGLNFQQFASADTEGKLKMLGQYMSDTKDKAQATALVMAAFGGRQGAQMLPLIQNFSKLDDYAKSLKMPVMDTAEIQLAAEKTKMLQTAMSMLMDSVMVKLLPWVDKIGKAFYDLFADINHPIAAVKGFESELGPVASGIMGVITAMAAMKVVNAVTSTISGFASTLKAAGTSAVSTARFLGIMAAKEVEGEAAAEALTIKTIASTVATKAQAAATKTSEIVQTAFNAVKDSETLAWIRSTTATVANTVAKTAQTVATKAAEIAQAAFNLVMDANPIVLVTLAIAALIAGVILLVTHWKTVVSWIKEVWNWFNHLGTGVKILIGIFAPFLVLPAEIVAHWGQIKNFFHDIIANITRDWNDLVSGAEKWGENLVKMIAQGISNAVKDVESAVGNVASSIKKFLGFGSPTEAGPGATSDAWAPNLMRMYTDGIMAGIPQIQSATQRVAGVISDYLGNGSTESVNIGASGGSATSSSAAASSAGAPIILQVDGRTFATLIAPHMDQAMQRNNRLKLKSAGATP
ncbi:hypothetical protein [Alicyclobacillus sp. ALC3]|uniref:hypothetical protein n=1 Tax=Alicyclobacillus sp. ALC3 TaxID=2796143 RepID=UPI002378A6B4|nr:hypothetical protein [Alicyclobacillus sp. ALC3]WDL98122.1 hypothetical protein JC200_05320 [Alicyclobacillus sp. ALC3]